MRFKNIRLYFFIALAVAAALRAFQVFYTADAVTGFLKPAYKNIGIMLIAALFIIAASVAAVCLTIRRCPVKMPHINKKTGITAFLVALTILWQLTILSPSANTPNWQLMLLKISGAVAAVFFGAIGVKSIKNFKIPSVCYIAPVIYWLVRLIYVFTATSSLALIADNLFMLAAEIFVLLFMFEFALLANKLDTQTNYKKIALTGFTSIILCTVAAIPQVVFLVISRDTVTVSGIASAALQLATGGFIYSFLRSHFSGKNLKKRRRHSKWGTKIMVGESTDNFYMG